MAVPTQTQIAQQMIRQLRILDPSVSAALGTPERKIIDTVAQALADAQLDLSVLSNALDLDTKFGSDLDKFLSVFNFARQTGVHATGVVTFSRSEASNLDIRIPVATQLAASTNIGETDQLAGLNVTFQTTTDVILSAGQLEVSAPIRATQPGAIYNVAANVIQSFVGTPVFGITGVTNTVPTLGGIDSESDAELRVRFKNTLFRNLAGTQDQYLALAIAGAFTNKANVIGPISRFREYIQVPLVDDATGGNGNAGEYTTSLSTIPYSDHTYTTVPSFITTDQNDFSTYLTEGVDFLLNTTDQNRGDTFRFGGLFGKSVDEEELANLLKRPNVTLLTVYTGTENAVQAIRPGDVILLEHSYLSTASRNDYDSAITNCVDVFINGANRSPATTVIPRPEAGVNLFVNNASNRFHFENFRRVGSPDTRPLLGNIFSPLYWNPLEDLPETLTISNVAFQRGTHYWPVIDVSELGGTVRARTGIEWSADARGGPANELGPRITAVAADSIEIANYTYDRNVIDLQSSLEASKQVTTDVLVHKATTRYFKFNINVMYTPGVFVEQTNANISLALSDWLNGLYFGNTIQLSDVLQRVHNVNGVDNVRWTRDVDPSVPRVVETDADGNPRADAIVDRRIFGTTSPDVVEIQQWYFSGTADSGGYTISYEGDTTAVIAADASAATVESAFEAATGESVTVTGSGTPSDPFTLTWGVADFGSKELIEVDTSSFEGLFTFNEDFTLLDNELPALPAAAPGDTSDGLLIKTRAQNTWAH